MSGPPSGSAADHVRVGACGTSSAPSGGVRRGDRSGGTFAESSSWIVSTPSPRAMYPPTGFPSLSRSVSFASLARSPTTGTRTEALVSPGGKVTVPKRRR